MSLDELVVYQGKIVPQSLSAGFVALSYFVSFIGAASTLELINRRTGSKGLFNNVLLGSAAVTMGGVSIWSMHFIGNRAIHMANGEAVLQIAFSPKFTTLSFFVPIVVLWGAFWAIGTNDAVSWSRIGVGGLLCGTAVCGMHYLGNASIQNYVCMYHVGNVIGSALIAVTASTVALSTFFVFRAMWDNAWWKRMFSGLVMAGAVSGMHWCAARGTQYRLISIEGGIDHASRDATVIVVICLSIGACTIIASLAMLKARNMSKSARRAQQITLGAAIFDKHDRILVDPDGLIPSTIITDSFLETNDKESFDIAHPLYQWMFQASRNWSPISSLANAMKKHVSREYGHYEMESRQTCTRLMSHGEPSVKSGFMFRELFCVAAMSLAERLREDLNSIGILWDEMLPTGANGRRTDNDDGQKGDIDVDMAEKGTTERRQEYGRGSLLLLVRRVTRERDTDRLTAAGYRFADLHQVSHVIASSMQIQSSRMETKFRDMAVYADQRHELQTGIHLGLFGIRARVNGSGFDVLVQSGAKHLLPSVCMQSSPLDHWQERMLRRFNGVTISAMLRGLVDTPFQLQSERLFVDKLAATIRELQDVLHGWAMDEAVFAAEPVILPCASQEMPAVKLLLAFRLVMPIHSVAGSVNCEFIPLSFFKIRQMSQFHHLAFIQGVHREYGQVIQDERQRTERQVENRWVWGMWNAALGKPASKSSQVAAQEQLPRQVDQPDSSDVRSANSGSMISLFQPGSGDIRCAMSDADNEDLVGSTTKPALIPTPPPPYGGIMVSQEITVNVETADYVLGDYSSSPESSVRPRSMIAERIVAVGGPQWKAEIAPSEYVEMQCLRSKRGQANGPRAKACDDRQDYDLPATFVDDLFKQCVEGRSRML